MKIYDVDIVTTSIGGLESSFLLLVPTSCVIDRICFVKFPLEIYRINPKYANFKNEIKFKITDCNHLPKLSAFLFMEHFESVALALWSTLGLGLTMARMMHCTPS